MPKKRPRGRRTGRPDTRAAIVDVARSRFAEAGYTSTTVRAIARAAAVDAALVHHYFGTKRGLYAAVMDSGDRELGVAIVPGTTGATHGATIVSAVLEAWDRPAARASLTGLIRSSASDSQARVRLDGLLQDAIARPLAAGLDGARALTRVRSALVAAQLVGLAWARYVAETEPLASASVRVLARIYGAALDAILDGSDYGAR